MFKLATVSLVLLLSAAAGAATPPQRVVILDALQLTPGLEKANAHQRMNDAVTATVKEHGWELVASTTECHNLTCAGLLAANAKARYVLVLLGDFSPTDFYATDVGVSLWRDGGVIATRAETDEQADFDKAGGGTFVSCGPPAGTCTVPLLTSKLMQYTAKLLDDEAAAIHNRETALTIAPTAAALKAPGTPMIAVPAAPEASQNSGVGRILGWSLVGGGAVLVGGGISLWAFNNSGTNCHSVGGDASACRETRHTSTATALVGGAGLIAVAAGVVILLFDSGPSKVALSADPGGLVLGGRF